MVGGGARWVVVSIGLVVAAAAFAAAAVLMLRRSTYGRFAYVAAWAATAVFKFAVGDVRVADPPMARWILGSDLGFGVFLGAYLWLSPGVRDYLRGPRDGEAPEGARSRRIT